MASVVEMMATMNDDVAGTLRRHLLAMPAEKQVWKPLDCGRSALDQVQECIGVNAWIAQSLRECALQTMSDDWLDSVRAEYDTPEKAAQGLADGTAELVAAMRALPADRHSDMVPLPWEEKPSAFVDLMAIPYWNMVYHLGQVSYIQTLYGDKAHH
ncbi:MAG: hypothetical protein KGJ62_06245 [Armatimonadetes bacterium]|nr:hypothetical protein [Armatimonadota bacterium]MDE2205886.1 hypothetical protein [Armatimonadota bacterium]